ncbi:DoxX family protein [Thermanaerothrix sp.]|jgi:uncharacterized membrane protein YphA (DoxX/SURF4 family)|uniref:DoxX family protein n=1 Tax=Thermanaerothrix sp. TaxID=2972675 RepID=UPI002ADE14DE|nr:DoxX family protein [Thermanaerothrix sp.]
MDVVFLVGRLIVGAYYLINAANHILQVKALSGYAQSKGVPTPRIAVLGSGVLLLVGGLSILTGYYPLIGILALVIFFLPVTFIMHAYWKIQDPMMRTIEMVNFMKNLALMGSALMFLAIPQPWPYRLF